MKLKSLFEKFKKDTDFRIKNFLLFSIIFNILYSVFLLIISQIFFSKWFFTMSIYYGTLSLARIFLYFQTIKPKTDKSKEILIMRNFGYYLFFLNLVVAVMMFILIYTAKQVKHHEITVITLATYTFTALSFCIISSIKHFKTNNHVYSTIKVVSLVSVSVSMVTLTNTMLATFGTENDFLRSIILPILCGYVSIFIMVCAILMIIKANKDLKVIKNE